MRKWYEKSSTNHLHLDYLQEQQNFENFMHTSSSRFLSAFCRLTLLDEFFIFKI